MATTVNNAFTEFMKEKVNLDQEKTKIARSSRDNLIDNIKGFSGDSNFEFLGGIYRYNFTLWFV